MFKQQPIDPKILAEAIDWFLLQSEQTLTTTEQRAFDDWKNQSKQHFQAWQRTEKLQQRLGNIPSEISKKTLQPTRSPAIPIGKLMVLFTCGSAIAGAAYLSNQQAWLADYRTPYGEQRDITLEDGTILKLNSKTAVDIHYTAKERQIVLHYGEIFIATAKERNTPYRPFKVLNRDGVIQALGTQFNVSDKKKYTAVTVLEHAVKVIPAQSSQHLILNAGQQVSFDTQMINSIENAEFDQLMWRKGLFIAHRMHLKDFAKQLTENYGVNIRIDNNISDLQISGTYPMDNLDRILITLQDTYGLQSDQNFLNTQITISKKE